MSQIPRDPALDGTFALLTEGYDFIWNRCRRLETDVFQTRLLGRRALCIHGREAAELFYDSSKFRRSGAVPRRVVTSLFGKRGVQTLDDAAHRHRKAAFLSLMGPASLQALADVSAREWRLAIARWARGGPITLFEEAQRLLTRAACSWAGVPLSQAEVARRARDFGLMVDAFGGVGPRLWKGKLARARTERWITGVVEQARRGRLAAAPGSALRVMAEHRDLRGRQLPARTAAVELINVLRPTAAIAWYVTFTALALHEHPGARRRLATGAAEGGGDAACFVQEVRRHYPFTPFLGAKVRAGFEWRGHHFDAGTLVLLDVHGTNHDPRTWEAPDEFRPQRFEGRRSDGFDFIPQGGGEAASGHRCAGEQLTVSQLALATHFLARCIEYDVPEQDSSFELRRMPTRPRSGFVMRNVRATPALDAAVPPIPNGTREQRSRVRPA